MSVKTLSLDRSTRAADLPAPHPTSLEAQRTEAANVATQVAEERLRAGADLVAGERAPALRGADRLGRLDEATLGRLVAEAAAKMTENTGLPLDLTKVKVEVLGREAVAARIMADAKARFGGEDERATTLLGRFQQGFARLGMKHGVLAAYLPSEKTVVCVQENAENATVDGFRGVLHHELLHAAQDQNFPKLFASVSEAVAAWSAADAKHGSKSAEYEDARDTVNARMAWIEGHPYYHDCRTLKRDFPDAKMGIGVKGAALGVLTLLSRDGREKVMQYFKGQAAFRSLYDGRQEALIEAIYKTPALADVLLKTRGKVELKVRNDVKAEDLEQITTLLAALRSESGTRGSIAIQLVTEDGRELPIPDGTAPREDKAQQA